MNLEIYLCPFNFAIYNFRLQTTQSLAYFVPQYMIQCQNQLACTCCPFKSVCIRYDKKRSGCIPPKAC